MKVHCITQRQEHYRTIPYSRLSPDDQAIYDSADVLDSPDNIFNRKVEALSELLSCTEAEATRIILHRI